MCSLTILDAEPPTMDNSILHYSRSTKRMLTAFEGHEEAIRRTLEIADRIETDDVT